MRFSLLAAGLVFAALIPAATATPQATGEGTIGGQVLGTDGKPVSGARVTLQASEGKRPKTTETNEQGRFWFPSLVTGLYDLRAYSEGHLSDWRRNVWVDRGKQTNVTLRLRPKKPVPDDSPPPPEKP